MLTVQHLSKSFGSTEILHGVSFDVPDGRIVGFIGPNGAGKTTTIKSCVGLYPVNSNTVLVNAIDIAKDPIGVKQIISYVPDTPSLYDSLTPLQYFDFIKDIYQVDPFVVRSHIATYAEGLKLTDKLSEPIVNLSHGTKQKVAVLSALLHDPKLLILDEPFVGLDPQTTHYLKQLMKELVSNGSSVLFSSHVLEVVENVCDSIVMIKDGSIIATGTLDEIKRSNVSLEDFFLQMNADGEK